MMIAFTKASGAGNDFIILDNRDGALPADKPALARALCDRHFGVGADGLLLLQQSPTSDFHMQYYNADGSHGGMCGNGGRCIARFAHEKGLVGREMSFEALDHLYTAECVEGGVRLTMKDPGPIEQGVHLAGIGAGVTGHFVDTGSPHYVILHEDIDSLEMPNVGRSIRHHPRFQPAGTNVNFVKVNADKSLSMRTYERGVEAETLACGTGSIAVAAVGMMILGMNSPVTVRTRSGETLLITMTKSGNRLLRPILEGSAHMLFDGTLLYDEAIRRIGRNPSKIHP